MEFGEIPEGIACKQFAACAVDAVLNEEAHVAGGFSEFETASTDEVLRYVSTDGSIDCISHGKRTVVGPFFACRIVGAQYLDEGRIATIGVLRAAGILQGKSRNLLAEVSLNIVPRCGVGTVSGLPSSVEISGVVTIEQIGESAFVGCNCVRFENSSICYEVISSIAEAFAFGSTRELAAAGVCAICRVVESFEFLIEGVLLNGLCKSSYAFCIEGVELELVAQVVLVVPIADVFALVNSRVPLSVVGCTHNDKRGTAGSGFNLEGITVSIDGKGGYTSRLRSVASALAGLEVLEEPLTGRFASRNVPDVLGIFNGRDLIGRSSLVAEQELSLGSLCVVIVKIISRRAGVADVVVTCYQRIHNERSLGSGKLASPFLNLFLGKTSGIG